MLTYIETGCIINVTSGNITHKLLTSMSIISSHYQIICLPSCELLCMIQNQLILYTKRYIYAILMGVLIWYYSVKSGPGLIILLMVNYPLVPNSMWGHAPVNPNFPCPFSHITKVYRENKTCILIHIKHNVFKLHFFNWMEWPTCLLGNVWLEGII